MALSSHRSFPFLREEEARWRDLLFLARSPDFSMTPASFAPDLFPAQQKWRKTRLGLAPPCLTLYFQNIKLKAANRTFLPTIYCPHNQ